MTPEQLIPVVREIINNRLHPTGIELVSLVLMKTDNGLPTGIKVTLRLTGTFEASHTQVISLEMFNAFDIPEMIQAYLDIAQNDMESLIKGDTE